MDEVERQLDKLVGGYYSDRPHAAAALGTLAKVNPDKISIIFPALVRAIRDRNPFVRNAAMVALYEMGAPAFPSLVKWLMDENRDARAHVVYAIFRISQSNPDDANIVNAVPALVGLLNDNEASVRLYTAQALANVVGGYDKIEEVETIEKMLKEAPAALKKSRLEKDELHGAMANVAELINKVAAKKNELARMEMEKDGLRLAGERPRPHKKDGGMYQEISRKTRAIRNG